MSESTTEETMAPQAAEGEAVDHDHAVTSEGRYIPYGGGSMGWFENSGVMKCEVGKRS